jgi:hypothetical protein
LYHGTIGITCSVSDAAPCSAAALAVRFQELFESSSVVERCFLRGKDERGRFFTEARSQFGYLLRIRIELGEVSTPKLRPFLSIVLIPTAKLIGRSDVLRPSIDRRVRF